MLKPSSLLFVAIVSVSPSAFGGDLPLRLSFEVANVGDDFYRNVGMYDFLRSRREPDILWNSTLFPITHDRFRSFGEATPWKNLYHSMVTYRLTDRVSIGRSSNPLARGFGLTYTGPEFTTRFGLMRGNFIGREIGITLSIPLRLH